MQRHYDILGLSYGASLDDIKKAYKRLSLKYHPDKSGSSDMFIKVNEAYQILRDRSNYNFYALLMNLIINMDMQLSIDVSLEEIYNAKVKKIIVQVKRENLMKNVILYISLLNYKTEYVFKKMGDNRYRDIIIKINIIEHPMIKIDNVLCIYDLYIDKYISLYEYYYGVYLFIELLNIDEVYFIDQKLSYVIRNKGIVYQENGELKRGDVYIYFKLKLPNHDAVSLSKMEPFIKKHFS
jgi:DnaJ-class molecular chaperone